MIPDGTGKLLGRALTKFSILNSGQESTPFTRCEYKACSLFVLTVAYGEVFVWQPGNLYAVAVLREGALAPYEHRRLRI
jgi:hypothetical protein